MADITRAEVASLIGEQYGPEVLSSAAAGSAVLSAFPTVDMGTKTTHMPVLATLPKASWVGDTDNKGVKSTSKVTWQDKTLVAEEIAVIIPIHENTLDDATEDVLTRIAELGGQAIGQALDLAVLFGEEKPASWTSPDLLAAATDADQIFEVGTKDSDIYGSFNLAAGALADVGFEPEAAITKRSLQYKLANLRGEDGHLILSNGSLGGFTTTFSRNGGWDADLAEAFVVDPARVRIGVRQDVTVKFLDQATLGTGAEQINLAERDMVALRFKARYAYVLGQGATSEGSNKTPVAAIVPAGAGDDSGEE